MINFNIKGIDAHGLKIQGGGYLKFLPKSLGGVKGFRKNCQGGPPILGFIAFLLTNFSKICLGGAVSVHLCTFRSCNVSKIGFSLRFAFDLVRKYILSFKQNKNFVRFKSDHSLIWFLLLEYPCSDSHLPIHLHWEENQEKLADGLCAGWA
jgi:hypothetical protein